MWENNRTHMSTIQKPKPLDKAQGHEQNLKLPLPLPIIASVLNQKITLGVGNMAR
jgi:hypothetical protein